MASPGRGPGALTLRIVAAILLGDASLAVIIEPGRLAVVAFSILGAAMAGICLWVAHWLAQVKRAERRRKERI
jgi:hypothetical protein